MKPSRRSAAVLLGLAAVLAFAVPVIAADASPEPGPPGRENKPPKGPEVAVTVRGEVTASTDEKGRPAYTLTASGTTWELSAGPKWFWGTSSPLAAHAGTSVTVVGTHREGSTDLDVDTIDGAAIREAGRPAWAGGPSWVGQKHPGWKAWKLDGKPGRGLGLDKAPGQSKDKTTGD